MARTFANVVRSSSPPSFTSSNIAMAFLGLRKWPTPVAKPMAPFIAATALTYYLIGSLQDMAVRSDTYANDPKNPYAAQVAKEKAAVHQ